MLNIIYYLNGQELERRCVETASTTNLFDFQGTTYNSIVNINNKEFISRGANYNLFTNTLEIVLINKCKFEYDIFYKDFDKSIISDLEFLGYTKSEVCGTGCNLITNSNQGKYYFTDNDYSNGGMGYVCNNKDVALGIAAINKHSDKFQWFAFPFNEYDFCECENVIEEFGSFECTEYPRKMTPEEIINQFNTINNE